MNTTREQDRTDFLTEAEALRDMYRGNESDPTLKPDYREDCGRFADELDALIARCGWQPIETAPIEGVIHLAVESSDGDRRVFVAEATEDEYGRGWAITTGWTGWTTLHTGWTPVAWMPLPAAPGQEGGEPVKAEQFTSDEIEGLRQSAQKPLTINRIRSSKEGGE